MKIEDLSNTELLAEYSYAVKSDHYDPLGDMRPKFDSYELRAEIFKRMGGR